MVIGFADPLMLSAAFSVHSINDSKSDWLEDVTAGPAAFPPINVFQQGKAISSPSSKCRASAKMILVWR